MQQDRPPFIVNLDEVEEEPHYLDSSPEAYRSRKRLGKATGSRDLGVNYSRLRPGQVSSKLHSHSAEEEFVLILSGEALLRYGDARYQLRPGDAVSLRPGGPAHQLYNESDGECLYLEIGMRDPDDVITYPEHEAEQHS